MTGAPETFESLAAELADRHANVIRNSKGSLAVDGRVCAMTSKGAIVVRLAPDRVLELVASGEGHHYKGQVNAWLQLAADLPAPRSRELVEESLGL